MYPYLKVEPAILRHLIPPLFKIKFLMPTGPMNEEVVKCKLNSVLNVRGLQMIDKYSKINNNAMFPPSPTPEKSKNKAVLLDINVNFMICLPNTTFLETLDR